MILRSLILLILLSLESELYSQTVLPSKVYCAHEKTCVQNGISEGNIVVEFSKGLAKITSYYTKNDILNTSILRVTYSGAYYIIEDTIRVKLITKWSELRYKVPLQGSTTIPDASNSFIPTSNLLFLIKNNSLIPICNYLPALAISSEAAANDLALRFDALPSNSTKSSKYFSMGNQALH